MLQLCQMLLVQLLVELLGGLKTLAHLRGQLLLIDYDALRQYVLHPVETHNHVDLLELQLHRILLLLALKVFAPLLEGLEDVLLVGAHDLELLGTIAQALIRLGVLRSVGVGL